MQRGSSIVNTVRGVMERDAVGTRGFLEESFAGRPIRSEHLIVDGGQLAGTGAASHSVSGTTSSGSRGQ